MLGVVADFCEVAGFLFTLVDFELAGEELEEGGFTGAVGADEDDFVAALDGEVEVFVDAFSGVGLADFFEVDDFLV